MKFLRQNQLVLNVDSHRAGWGILVLAFCLGLSPSAFGQENDLVPRLPHWFQHQRDHAWLHNYDPTLLSNRLLSELSYEDFDNGKETLKLETSIRWGISLSEDLALGVQVLAPVAWTETSADTGTGLGDLEFRSGLAGRIRPGLRWALAMNCAFDTATDPLTGGSILELRPIAALRWDASDRLNLGLNVEYNFTPEDEGPDEVSALEIKVPMVMKINDKWAAAITFKPRWNLLTETARNRLEFGVTRMWGSDHQYAFSAAIEIPLRAETLEGKLIAGFAWYF